MNTLNYAGFPIDECYGIIKAIAKKHPEKVKPLKERFITGFKDKIMQDDGSRAGIGNPVTTAHRATFIIQDGNSNICPIIRKFKFIKNLAIITKGISDIESFPHRQVVKLSAFSVVFKYL